MLHAQPSAAGADAEIVIVGGKPYAFGLRWASAISRSTLVVEAVAAASAERASFVVIHRAQNQFGLAAIGKVPAGVGRWFYRPRCGIAAVASAVGTATLAAFPLDDDRWLVLAIDRKGFLPDGDMIVADATQAKARVERLIARSPSSWRRKFLPEEWGIPDSKRVNPAELLFRSGVPHLVPVWRLRNRRRIGFAVAAVLLLLASAVVGAVRFATAPPPIPVTSIQPPKPIPASWTPAGLALDSCLSALRSAQRYNGVPGWVPSKYSCLGGESVVIEFARIGTGQIGMMRTLLPQARLSDDGRSAVLALPLASLPRITAVGVFASRERYRVTGLDLSQRLNGIFTLQAGRKLLPGEAETAQSNQAWKLFSWSYRTQAPAIVWAGAIARLGSISIDALVFTPADNTWQLTGSLYASN